MGVIISNPTPGNLKFTGSVLIDAFGAAIWDTRIKSTDFVILQYGLRNPWIDNVETPWILGSQVGDPQNPDGVFYIIPQYPIYGVQPGTNVWVDYLVFEGKS